MFMLTDPLLLSGESRAEASVTGPLPAGARTAGDDGSALQIKMLRGAHNGWRPFARARPKDSITSARPFGILRWVGAPAGGNGSGIHFDRGLVADTSYAFTLRDVLRVETGLQAGWIQSVDDFGPGYERVVGAGLALEFSGPWSTLMNVRTGRALSSTIAGRAGGGGELRFVVFKTFDRWSRRPKP